MNLKELAKKLSAAEKKYDELGDLIERSEGFVSDESYAEFEAAEASYFDLANLFALKSEEANAYA